MNQSGIQHKIKKTPKSPTRSKLQRDYGAMGAGYVGTVVEKIALAGDRISATCAIAYLKNGQLIIDSVPRSNLEFRMWGHLNDILLAYLDSVTIATDGMDAFSHEWYKIKEIEALGMQVFYKGRWRNAEDFYPNLNTTVSNFAWKHKTNSLVAQKTVPTTNE